MNVLAPGKWTINEKGELQPDDDKAQTFTETGARQKAHETPGQHTYYCLYDLAAEPAK